MSRGDLTFTADGAQRALAAGLELLAECEQYAELLPSPLWDEAKRFAAVVAEHGETEQ